MKRTYWSVWGKCLGVMVLVLMDFSCCHSPPKEKDAVSSASSIPVASSVSQEKKNMPSTQEKPSFSSELVITFREPAVKGPDGMTVSLTVLSHKETTDNRVFGVWEVTFQKGSETSTVFVTEESLYAEGRVFGHNFIIEQTDEYSRVRVRFLNDHAEPLTEDQAEELALKQFQLTHPGVTPNGSQTSAKAGVLEVEFMVDSIRQGRQCVGLYSRRLISCPARKEADTTD